MKEFKIKSFDNYELACYLWDEVEQPKGILQLTHGMGEHATRYDRFARFLNKNGYLVFANDLRAHGMSAGSREKCGKLVTKHSDLFKDTVDDQIFLTEYLKETYPTLPLFLLGHSYGSFLTQSYIQKCSAPKATILMGSSQNGKGLLTFGLILARIIAFFCGNDHPGKLFANMSFGSYQKVLPEGEFWTTRDKSIVEKYKNDPFCNMVFSVGFYKCFFKGMKHLYTKKGLAEIPEDYPLLLISGKEDGVGDWGKGITKLYNTYVSHGKKNVTLKLFDDMRHEVLNEIGYEKVHKYLLDYINKHNK